jgi:hypothetical protein
MIMAVRVVRAAPALTSIAMQIRKPSQKWTRKPQENISTA